MANRQSIGRRPTVEGQLHQRRREQGSASSHRRAQRHAPGQLDPDFGAAPWSRPRSRKTACRFPCAPAWPEGSVCDPSACALGTGMGLRLPVVVWHRLLQHTGVDNSGHQRKSSRHQRHHDGAALGAATREERREKRGMDQKPVQRGLNMKAVSETSLTGIKGPPARHCRDRLDHFTCV